MHQTGVVGALFSGEEQAIQTFKLLLVFILLQREAREKILSILTDPLFHFIVRFYFSDVLCFPSNEAKAKQH